LQVGENGSLEANCLSHSWRDGNKEKGLGFRVCRGSMDMHGWLW
jgi:hypothetical protein